MDLSAQATRVSGSANPLFGVWSAETINTYGTYGQRRRPARERMRSPIRGFQHRCFPSNHEL